MRKSPPLTSTHSTRCRPNLKDESPTVKPIIVGEPNWDVSGKKVLIVEDAVHTGATIDVVVPALKAAGVADVKIAALSYVASRKPDFSTLPQGNYCFPWSVDYKDFIPKK